MRGTDETVCFFCLANQLSNLEVLPRPRNNSSHYIRSHPLCRTPPLLGSRSQVCWGTLAPLSVLYLIRQSQPPMPNSLSKLALTSAKRIQGCVETLVQVGWGWMASFSGGLWVEMSLSSLSLSTLAASELGLKMTVAARRSYFTFSLAVKKDEVITVLEWQLGSEVGEGSPILCFYCGWNPSLGDKPTESAQLWKEMCTCTCDLPLHYK